jgi:outer membrane protein OmpA-like peptidoglycan-associated protein
MPSELTFEATENFRKKLLVRNLRPYDESFKTGYMPGEGEFRINDVGVANSPSVEESGVNKERQKRAFIQNQYGPEGGYKNFIDIRDVEKLIEKRERYYTFVASTYNSFNLLTSLNPFGNNGSLSQDSALAQIAGQQLKTEFEYRIGEEIRQETLGRINVIDALSDPFDALAIATGNEQVIESSWQISVPDNVVGKGLDFISRITGVYSPYSWIPGDYFAAEEKKSFINQAVNAVGSLFGDRGTPLLPENKKASDIFLANTGRGQRNRLFKTLEFSRYRPDYKTNFINNLNLSAPKGNYYIGSRTEEPSQILFPQDQLPIDQDGNKVQTPVRGYGELAKSYEKKENVFAFGLNGSKLFNGLFTNSTYEAKRLQGGFVWLSTKTEGASKRMPTVGGGSAGEVDLKNGFDETPKSNTYNFREGSILDDTQKLVEAADELGGDKKLQHVGNAINQVSKVFNDGTREMTKGSMVINYENTTTGAIEGTEYCRVFTKDIPYNNVSALQKSEGITNSNRRFSYSVLDNTYNLNIAPLRGNESTNMTEQENVKKYMFSIENLAWRTGSKPGFTYQDLAMCERGPNGGRIMWFPPYDLNVSEQNSANWTTNEFLGRPEPIYTYNNTTRQGNLSWKIVVDHPSILNAIVDKELSNESSERVNAIVDSFFAGCRKYDIYELATRFPQFNYSDLYDIITKTENVTEYYDATRSINKVEYVPIEPVIEEYTNKLSDSDFDYSFYFDNDEPPPKTASAVTTETPYSSTLSSYLSEQSSYETNADSTQKEPITSFFNDFISTTEQKTKELCVKIKSAIDEGAEITIDLVGSASAPATNEYNLSLSKRRIDSVKKYILSFSELSKYEDKIQFNGDPRGEDTQVTGPGGETVTCGEDLPGNQNIYSVQAMACRAVSMKIKETAPPPFEGPPEPPEFEKIITPTDELYQASRTVTNEVETVQQKKEVAKLVVKKLLTECDYFNAMNEEAPFVYQGIQEKIKYFNPVFHSITPEGLNSRLTFLQQCLRPGDTIPVIGEDGKPREGNIQNTAFGAPPICVLRIGDFYHTKIAIQQISIQYEPLVYDLNPEGIGVQPMIADINMSFYFIGGQGLKEPVARLQNALSFNYYGNTEVYDDRAETTDIESRNDINRRVMEEVGNIVGLNLTDDTIQRTEEAGNTIGEITDTRFDVNDIIGDINYKASVNELVQKSKDYVENTINTIETINNDQSGIGLYYFTQTRNYQEGLITGNIDNTTGELGLNIFGKPTEIENRVETLLNDLIDDVNNDSNPFLVSPGINDIYNANFKNSEIRKFKKNLKSWINAQIGSLTSTMTTTLFNLEEKQTELVRVIDKLNLVQTLTDGHRKKSGNIVILSLSATTDVDVSSNQADTLLELIADIETVGFDLQEVYDSIFEDTGLLPPKQNLYTGFLTRYNLYDTEPQTRFCTLAYPFIINDPETFKDLILGPELSEKPEWVSYVNKVLYGTPTVNLPGLGNVGSIGLEKVYTELQRTWYENINDFKVSNPIKKFTLYNPFNTDKERNFTYLQEDQDSIVGPTQKPYFFETTFPGQNSGELNKFNLKYTFN